MRSNLVSLGIYCKNKKKHVQKWSANDRILLYSDNILRHKIESTYCRIRSILRITKHIKTITSFLIRDGR